MFLTIIKRLKNKLKAEQKVDKCSTYNVVNIDLNCSIIATTMPLNIHSVQLLGSNRSP